MRARDMSVFYFRIVSRVQSRVSRFTIELHLGRDRSVFWIQKEGLDHNQTSKGTSAMLPVSYRLPSQSKRHPRCTVPLRMSQQAAGRQLVGELLEIPERNTKYIQRSSHSHLNIVG